MHTLSVKTQRREQLVDITGEVEKLIGEAGFTDGLLALYVPHTTAGIAINEHADPTVAQDIDSDLKRLVPWEQPYYKHREGNSSSHTRSTMVGSSELVIVEEGKMVLGTWQGVFFCEFDGPRQRKVYVKLMGG